MLSRIDLAPLTFNQDLLNQTTDYLQQYVAPHANLIDRDPQALRKALQGLGDRHLLALRVAQPNQESADELTYRAVQELIARYSGALAFLQTQHQSAAIMLQKSQNEALQQEYLPHLSTGEKLIGLGFSQLRRSGQPLVQAIATPAGYRLQGKVPWITGYGCFQHFIIGAALPDGQAIFGLMPFVERQQSGGSLSFSPPLQLAAMASTQTVTATLNQWLLPHSQLVSLQPPGWIHHSDRQNVLHLSFFNLGCARAGLDILAAAQSSSPFVEQALELLDQELTACRVAIYQAHSNPQEPTTDRLKLRAWAIDLAVRCAHASVAVSSGAANYSDHPAQRVYREALAFTVFGQTTAAMEATLAQLVRKTGGD